MLTIELKGGDELIARFEQMPENIRSELQRTVTALSIELEAYVKTKKLSGQVLNVKTGALRSSIFHDVETQERSVIGIVGAPRSVPYAAIHEFGGTINHPGGTPYFIGSDGKAIFVSLSDAKSAGLPRTKPHLIHMPERSYLRSSLKEMMGRIKSQMREAIVRGTNKGNE